MKDESSKNDDAFELTRQVIARRPGFIGNDICADLIVGWLRGLAILLECGAIKIETDDHGFSISAELVGRGTSERAGAVAEHCDDEMLRLLSTDFEIHTVEEAGITRVDTDFQLDRVFLTTIGKELRHAEEKISGALDTLALANPRIRLQYRDHRSGRDWHSHFPGGALERCRQLAALRSCGGGGLFSFVGEDMGVCFDIAFQWTRSPGLTFEGVVNGNRTWSGGTHLAGVWVGVARAIHDVMVKRGLLEESVVLDGTEIPRNAVLVVTVRTERPKWGPATRDCLHDEVVGEVVARAVAEGFVEQIGDQIDSTTPPWQQMAAFHFDEPWLERFAANFPFGEELVRPGDVDGMCDGYESSPRLKRQNESH